MGTGYMGMEEPEEIPHGSPENNPPSEKTITQVKNSTEVPLSEEEPKKNDAPKVEEPLKEPEKAAEAEPKVVEKIVEKIIEKHPEFKDESSKDLYDRFVNGDTDGIYNYLSQIKKNYDTMSDLDVVREGLAKTNPAWTKEDVELELRAVYGKQLEKWDLGTIDKEEDPEGYKEAVAHNELVDDNLLRLQRAARDSRVSLKEQQKTIQLPKIEKEAPAPTADAPTQEQIDESKRIWAEAATNQVPALADYKFQVGDDKNPEEVVFAVTNEEKSARVEAMKTWEGADFMARRGWKNDDGSFNLLKIAEDEHTLENVTKMVKSAYTQGVTNGRKKEVETIKNIDNEKNRQDAPPAEAPSAGKLVWG